MKRDFVKCSTKSENKVGKPPFEPSLWSDFLPPHIFAIIDKTNTISATQINSLLDAPSTCPSCCIVR
ncbi:hypothetical protein SESBI_08225 [Sesbania bispinosa]|nr:hypothetical protein SESBI_08225 [Sesbania bispinosa]